VPAGLACAIAVVLRASIAVAIAALGTAAYCSLSAVQYRRTAVFC